MENLLQNQALVKVKKSIFLTCLYVALLTAKYKKKYIKRKTLSYIFADDLAFPHLKKVPLVETFQLQQVQ